MSGGFFRGTSTDQDTRFSNKKAKLLKSKKFASELETLVDMTKVKMDVMRPWIAKRVTELIGFEDEVLINFIYGLLEGKEVNGKEIQISLTGFMERNTGKFMKELWLLLLSAQQNFSGIPQQFLDAKEEETKKKKADTDRIAHEILRKKEKEEQEFERETAKMDGDGDTLRDKAAELELNSKPDSMVSSFQPADENKQRERKSMRGRFSPTRNCFLNRDSKSPHLGYHSSSPSDRWSSRSVSRSPPRNSRSMSSERRYPTSPRQSPTPRKRHVVQPSPSPPRRRSFYSKRRSISPPRRRSPSPSRYRARLPRRNRSRSPLSHRSRSPFNRRSRSPRRRSRTPIRTSTAHHKFPSPFRRRSPSPLRHRAPSPVRRKSPSPARRRSPSPLKRRTSSPLSDKSPSHGQRRSPSALHHRPRSPFHRKPPYVGRESRSPVRRRYQRSPSTPRQQSISPARRMSSMIGRKKSLSPVPRRSPRESSSPSSIQRNSISPVWRESSKSMRSPQQSHGERVRSLEKNSPAHFTSPSERAELSAKNHRGSKPVDVRPIISLRSPQRDMLDQNDLHGKEPALSLSKKKTPLVSDASRERAHCEEQRSSIPRDSLHQRMERVIRPESPIPMVKAAGPKHHSDHYGASVEDKNFSAREIREQKYGRGTISLTSDQRKDLIDSTQVHVLDDVSKSKKSQLTSSEGIPDRMNRRERYEKPESSEIRKTTTASEKKSESYVDEGDRAGDVNSVPLGDSKRDYRLQESAVLPKLSRKSELNDLNGSADSPSKEFDEHKTKVKEKKKRSKSDRHDVESDDSSSDDSYEERKEVKRRRKEEKKLKREERRRRRDERHRRKEERRAEKWKLKSMDTGKPLSDLEGDYSEDDNDHKRLSQTRGNKDTKSEQKNLEIELREKALESLRAKKGIGNSKD
ncbi:uncharacterized protein LOC142541151 isoform X2 [Primulina tabacum]|uniref:uncharacterized protein LOC142541151 isoform X2 n=1 Tax=Primulina tabacum TaxID=48773 RepID=UPI003F5AA10E